MVKFLYTFYFILLPIPLFFTTGLRVYNVEYAAFTGPGVELINIGFLFSFILILFDLKRNISSLFQKNSIFLNFFLIYCITVFFLKIIIGGSDGNPILLMVSILPLAFHYMIGFSFRGLVYKNIIFLNVTVNRTIFIFSSVVFAHISYSITKLGLVSSFVSRGADSIYGIFSIHQKFVYFPTITASFFILSLFSKIKYKNVVIIIFLFGLIMNASREGVLLAVLGIFARSYYLVLYEKKNIKVFFLGVLGIVIFSFFIHNYLTTFESSSLVSKLKSLGQSGDYSAGRIEQIVILAHNLTGSEYDYSIGTGFSMTLGELGTPHNQYLEILYRSGIFGLCAFMICLVYALILMNRNIKKCKKERSEDYNIIYAFFIIFILLNFVSFNINTPIRSMYACGLYGFLMGFFNNYRSDSFR